MSKRNSLGPRIESSSVGGRGLFAGEGSHYIPGDSIATYRPIVYCVTPTMAKACCHWCLNSDGEEGRIYTFFELKFRKWKLYENQFFSHFVKIFLIQLKSNFTSRLNSKFSICSAPKYYQCSGCRYAVYCSKECAKAAYKLGTHRRECQLVGSCRVVGVVMIIFRLKSSLRSMPPQHPLLPSSQQLNCTG